MSWARIHRWLAIVLAVLLVIWSITGLLFHLKPGWNRAYDMLSERRATPLALGELVPLASLPPASRVELFDSALGPLYRLATDKGAILVDARTGAVRSPLDADAARTIALDAASRSQHRYGEITNAALDDTSARFTFSVGATVVVGRRDARISQRGSDTDRIDWLYRMHYLQFTGNRSVDRAIAAAGLALIWAVMIPGIVLFVRRVRRRPCA